MSEVTRILEALGSGNGQPADELLPLVYGELRKLAASRMAGERAGHTLQATALVHEAWIKLTGPDGEALEWNDRRHFFAAAAEAMRRILIEHARRKMAERRGGDWVRVTFGDLEAPHSATPPEMVELDDALSRLAEEEPDFAEVAKLRLFAGLTVPEIAGTLDLSASTVKRRWSFAQAWLTRELKRARTQPPNE